MVGSHIRTLSSLAAPSFGSTPRVFNGESWTTWREAFQGLLEAALRDAEDMMVTIPYDNIRGLAQRHAQFLDAIQEARLVALDAGLDRNVLIDKHSRTVVGLLGFANVIWGDPLMAAVFLHASEAFWEGFGSGVRTTPGYRGRMLLSVRLIISYVRIHIYRSVASSDRNPTNFGTSGSFSQSFVSRFANLMV